MRPKFIVDLNVGRLAKWLRMIGYDTLFINGLDDDELIRVALREGRVLLTKDGGILRRGVVMTGKVAALLIRGDDVKEQLRQVVAWLGLEDGSHLFSLCLECNQPLVPRRKDEVEHLVPSYVFRTQDSYMGCPVCQRVYWRGTHWQRMSRELADLMGASGSDE